MKYSTKKKYQNNQIDELLSESNSYKYKSSKSFTMDTIYFTRIAIKSKFLIQFFCVLMLIVLIQINLSYFCIINNILDRDRIYSNLL